MTEMGTPDVTGGAIPPISQGHPELKAISKLTSALKQTHAEDATAGSSLRARMREIGRKAERVQITAGTACQALEVLSNIEDALAFALEAAREAGATRSLPHEALEELQKQIDVAVHCIDGLARQASFAGSRLFCGETSVGLARDRLQLPKLSAECLGTTVVTGMFAARKSTAAQKDLRIEYSQSLASVASGGPNSLAFWADGAVTVLGAGLEQVRDIKRSVAHFYRRDVLPAVKDLTVTVANALAIDAHVENLEEVQRLLAQLRKELSTGKARGTAGVPGNNVLKLLD